jgi:hypothetical protein
MGPPGLGVLEMSGLGSAGPRPPVTSVPPSGTGKSLSGCGAGAEGSESLGVIVFSLLRNCRAIASESSGPAGSCGVTVKMPAELLERQRRAHRALRRPSRC